MSRTEMLDRFVATLDEWLEQHAPTRPARPAARRFVAQDPVFGQLDKLAREHTQEVSYEFAKALWNLWGRIEKEFLTDKLTPAEKLVALRSVGDMLNLDPVARALISASEAAVDLGRTAAGKALPKTFDRQSVNPAGVDDLAAWAGLMKAKSYRTADELKATVVGKIRKLLEKGFATGEPNRATQERLRGEFTEMAGANLIEPGPQRTMNFKSPLVQETTVRTAMADASDHGKLDAWRSAADAGFVVGFERVEDIDPERNHPLSPKVNGLKIPWNHPLAQEFVGALHYSERGGIRPITARKAEAPGFTWSTDAEIRRAYEAKKRLSKDFV